MEQWTNRGRGLPRNTSVSAFVIFGTALAMTRCAQGSDVGLILWSCGAIVFVASVERASWTLRKVTHTRDADMSMIIKIGKLLCAGGLVAMALSAFPRGDTTILAVMLLAASVLIGLGAGLSGGPILTLTLALAATAVISSALSFWVPLTADLFLLIAVFVGLTLVALRLMKAAPPEPSVRYPMPTEPVTKFLALWSDLLLLPLFLNEREALIYLFMRSVVGLVTAAIASVQHVMLPILVRVHSASRSMAFRGLVARASLGVMLIGGALVLVALLVGPRFVSSALLNQGGLRTFHILLLATLVPVMLGVFPALMTALISPKALLKAYAAILVGVLASVILQGPDTASEMAMAVAIGHSFGACGLAVLNFRHLGLLPAVTALLHPQIRLRA